MGSPYADRPFSYVAWENVNFIYRTNATTATKTDLGIKDLDLTTTLATPVFGATYPRPPVLSRKNATGYDSSFVASAKLSSARSGGWALNTEAQYGNIIEAGASGVLSYSKYVITSGLAYAWNQPQTAIAALTALGLTLDTDFGIEDCDPNAAQSYVWGATLPHPGHAKIVNISSSPTGAGDVHTVKVADGKMASLPNGFRQVQPKFDWKAFGGA